MNIIKKSVNTAKDNKYDKLVNFYLKNVVNNLDYRSISDLGTCLCDVESRGIKINLSSKDCIKLGNSLLSESYNEHPDIANAFALQIASLERNSNFQRVADMLESAKSLKNSFIINNIAYAKYNLGILQEALNLQKYAIEIDTNIDYNHALLQYNLLLYEWSCNCNINYNYNFESFLEMLICDDISDYESAIVLAVYIDNTKFVKKYIEIFTKTFIFSKKTQRIINNYLHKNIRPSLQELLSVLKPKTTYGNALFFSMDY